ncbi:MAG TPA: hypothetical protein DCR93_10035 [Cytophagales bacterium]|nr:hypothetical protein [Cytophagales bacterium]
MSTHGRAQWLTEEDYQQARSRLVERFGADYFTEVPAVDESLLAANQFFWEQERERLLQYIDTVLRADILTQAQDVADTTLTEEERQERLVFNDRLSLKKQGAFLSLSRALTDLALDPYTGKAIGTLGAETQAQLVERLWSLFRHYPGYAVPLGAVASHLALPAAFADSLLAQPLPNTLAARLGDTLAEQRLITNFEAIAYDTAYQPATVDSAQWLLWVDSEKTRAAFFRALGSRHIQADHWGDESDRDPGGPAPIEYHALAGIMLKAYGRHFPGELNYYEQYVLRNYSLDEFYQTVLYYNAVADYLSRRYSVPLTIRVSFITQGFRRPQPLGEH